MAKRTQSAPQPVLKQIASDDWRSYFESFTLQHSGSPVSIAGEKDSMPLESIVARDGGRIVIHLGNDLAHHRIITIDAATVRIAQSDGVDQGVEIESTDGHRTGVALRMGSDPSLIRDARSPGKGV